MSSFDVIFVLPYPFSDHPSFPEGILQRALEAAGFSVGLIESPFWQERGSFSILGRPRLFFAVIPGPVDSVVLNYTSSRKRRREDLYQFGGKAFFEGYPKSISYKIRPDRTSIVFANRLRESFKEVPIVLGGLEASLRVFSHYDFQQQSIRRSILLDSRADLVVMGMGERQLVQLARGLRAGDCIGTMCLSGTAKVRNARPDGEGLVEIPSFEAVEADPQKLFEAQRKLEQARIQGRGVTQEHAGRFVVAERPEPYTGQDLDHIYGQPYSRSHSADVPLTPALQMNLFSVTSHRGCCGGCAFCSIIGHEGKEVISRSPGSVVDEIRTLTSHPLWRGYVSDIGGASAEMYGSTCEGEPCDSPSCLFPKTCANLSSVRPYMDLLRECRKVPGVRKIFVGSGIRYDILSRFPDALEEIMIHHAGRFLRVAPEHTEEGVLLHMRKPSWGAFEQFVRIFRGINKGLRRKIQLAIYLMIGHPGETPIHVKAMKKRLTSLDPGKMDVQIFTPSPGTLSAAMYYSGQGIKGEPIPVERNIKELLRRKHYLTEL